MVKILAFTTHPLAATPWTDGRAYRIPKINTSIIGRAKNGHFYLKLSLSAKNLLLTL
jgi:hypothetical protein